MLGGDFALFYKKIIEEGTCYYGELPPKQTRVLPHQFY